MIDSKDLFLFCHACQGTPKAVSLLHRISKCHGCVCSWLESSDRKIRARCHLEKQKSQKEKR